MRFIFCIAIRTYRYPFIFPLFKGRIESKLQKLLQWWPIWNRFQIIRCFVPFCGSRSTKEKEKCCFCRSWIQKSIYLYTCFLIHHFQHPYLTKNNLSSMFYLYYSNEKNYIERSSELAKFGSDWENTRVMTLRYFH